MATSIGSTNLTTANTWQLLEAINPDPSQSSTMAVYTNGNLVTSGVSQPGTTTVTAPLFINGRNGTSTNSYASYLAEVVVFNTGLSLSDRQMIEGYLAWKWGLQGNLPNTHPYYSATPSAGTTAVGNLTVDTTGNIQVAPTNTFRVLGPTEWRTNMITVSGTSLTIPTPTTGAPTTYSAALYTLTNTGFNALTLPTYTAGSPGVFWELYNSTASNLTIAVTYTSGSGLGSSFTLNAGSSTNIYWSGSAFQAISGQGPTGPTGSTGPGFTTITTPGSNFVLTTANSTSSNTAVANSNLTFNGSTLAVTGNVTTSFNGSTTSNAYGAGIDTLSIKSSLASYGGGISSLFFGNSTSTYPFARIAGVDTASGPPGAGALVFQTSTSTANAALSGTATFTYTGTNQTFTVPTGVTSMTVSMWGAGGGGGTYYGGPGAYVKGTLTVTAGQVLTIIVGQGGPTTGGTVYGGGGPNSTGNSGVSGSGGGRTAIQLTLTATITGSGITTSGGIVTYPTNIAHGLSSNQPVVITGLSVTGYNGTFIVASIPTSTSFTVSNATTGAATGTGTIAAELVDIAGGGGGTTNGDAGGGYGGYGGLTAGGNGLGETNSRGFGGTQTAGGLGTTNNRNSSTNGSALLGGLGSPNNGNNGPGGGGGYYGGGGGWGWYGAGGGGGSSYLSNLTVLESGQTTSGNTAPGTTNSFYVTGVAQGNSGGAGGNGLLVIQYASPFVLSEIMRIHSNGFVGIQNTTPATALDVNGGVTIRNGLRPLYSNVSSGTSLTVAANSYGTNFNITTSSLTGITLPTVVWSNDSNGYWTFRNNTSGYLPITFTYTGSYTTAPTNPVTIPPANSVTIMVTYPSGSTSNYVLF